MTVGTGIIEQAVGIYLEKKLLKMKNRYIEKLVWFLMIKLVKIWSTRYMDQWEKIKFDTNYGLIYLTISRQDQYPDSFDEIR